MSQLPKTRIAPGQQRPGGRTERVRKTVARSALAFIQKGRLDFSYQELAESAGVNKVTLYRRWPRRTDLLREAVGEHNSALIFPRRQSWPDSAEALLRRLAAFLGSPAELALNIALLSDPTAESSALMKSQWEPVQQRIEQVARDAQASGELPADIDAGAMMLMLMSPLVVMALLERKPIERKQLNELMKIMRRMRFSKSP